MPDDDHPKHKKIEASLDILSMIDALDKMTPEERLNILRCYCHHCGDKQLRVEGDRGCTCNWDW